MFFGASLLMDVVTLISSVIFLPKTRDGDSRSIGTAADPFKYFLSRLVPTLKQIKMDI